MDLETVFLIIIGVFVLYRLGLIKIHWSFSWRINAKGIPGSDKPSIEKDQVKQEKRKLEEQVNPDK
ncbi:MAG: hypothetical protein HKP55_12975 [Gammaproteobacteria bacterium]|nr:hypothetical protein [Gammaproteobacteria bacterium]NNJ92580.1 hypothetical protein [Gammaproteobacteria bacterium]